MLKKGVFFLITAAMLCALTLLPASSAITLNPSQIHNSNPAIELEYSEAVEILGGELLTQAGTSVRTYAPSDFTDVVGGKKYLVQLGLITPGKYQFTVQKRESAPPNDPLEEDVVWFEYVNSDTGLNIKLAGTNVLSLTPAGASPTGETILATSFAQSSPYSISFTTTKPAWCRYSTVLVTNPAAMTPFQVTGTPTNPVTTHQITGQTGREVDPLYVWCNSTTNNDSTAAFIIGYESEAPSITATLDPPVIVDPLQMHTNLSIVDSSQQKLYCEAVGESGTKTTAERYGLGITDAGAYQRQPWTEIVFAEMPQGRINKTFKLTCTNRAGRVNTTTVKVVIDLDLSPSIDQLSPEAYTPDKAPLLQTRVVKGGYPVTSARCFFTEDNAALGITAGLDLVSTDGLLYSYQAPQVADGTYTQGVTCVIAQGKQVTGTLDFVVDSTAPPARTMTVPAHLCGLDPLTAEVNLSKYVEEDPNFAGYDYNITFSQGTIVLESGFEPGSSLASTFTTELNETYKWHVWPTDLAGNLGAQLAGLTEVIPEDSTLCDDVPPTGYVDITQTSTGAAVQVYCDDWESGCTSTFQYSKHDTNATAASCTYAKSDTYGRNITFYKDGTLCFLVEDKNRNNNTGFQTIEVTANVPNASTHCTNGVLDAGLETGVDCGGQCTTTCTTGSGCSLDADCVSGFCNATGACEATSCTDAVKNGRETDVDCGGPACPACLENASCEASGDCDLGYYCDNGTCVAEPAPSECSTDSECAFDEACVNKVCIPTLGSACTIDTNCSAGEFCGPDGTCTVGSGQNCTKDANCPGDEFCDSGVCVSPGGNNPGVQNPAAGPSLLGLILIILGVVLMGGSGYWLYALHEEEGQASAPVRTAMRSQPEGLSPQQRLALAHQRQQQAAALKQRQAAEQRATMEKEKQRSGLLKDFDGETGKMGDAAPAKDKPADDEFVDVRDLGQKEKKYTKEDTISHEEPIKRKDSFTKLDKVIGKDAQSVKKDGDSFTELDKVINEDEKVKPVTKRRGADAKK